MEINFNIPANLSEVTVGQWQEWESWKNKNADASLLGSQKKIVEIFCGIPLDIQETFEVSEFERLANEIQEIFNEQPEELIRRFDMLGTEMGFIPNLSTISIGEFVDLESYLQESDTFHLAMSVLYRPIVAKKTYFGVERYEVEPYNPIEEHEDIYKAIPLDAALSARVFFYTLEKDLLTTSLTLLKEQVKKIKKKSTKTSQEMEFLTKSGDGITAFTDLLTKMQPKSKKLQLSL